MARLLGPDNNSRMAVLPSGAPAASRTGTVYTNAAGTVLADILAYQSGNPTVPGAAIVGSVVTTDAYGWLPLWWFPNGVDIVWISVNGGPIVPINADYDARLDAIGAGPISGITRDTQGRVTGYTEANSVWSAIVYDTAGRVASYAVAGTAHTVSYNAAGQITGVS